MAKKKSARKPSAKSTTSRSAGAAASPKRKAAKVTARRNQPSAKPASSGRKAGPAAGKASAKGATRRSSGARAKNAMTLVEALAVVLKGKQMSVSEAAVAVQKAGYKTTAENFRVMVNLAFIKNKKIFKRISHGVYVA
jgi:hypothetical protein